LGVIEGIIVKKKGGMEDGLSVRQSFRRLGEAALKSSFSPSVKRSETKRGSWLPLKILSWQLLGFLLFEPRLGALGLLL